MTTYRCCQDECTDTGARNPAEQKHFRLLDEFLRLPLIDSCCEYCHCECNSSHRSSDLSVRGARCNFDLPPLDTRERQQQQQQQQQQLQQPHHHRVPSPEPRIDSLDEFLVSPCNVSNESHGSNNSNPHCHALKPVKQRKAGRTRKKRNERTCSLAPEPKQKATAKRRCSLDREVNLERPPASRHAVKRSKSASSMRGQETRKRHTSNARDCKILHNLFTSLQDIPGGEANESGEPHCKHRARARGNHHTNMNRPHASRNRSCTLPPWPSLPTDLQLAGKATRQPQPAASLPNAKRKSPPVKLCQSMANLCLEPIVQRAFQVIPSHDKKILNRMAIKRSEKMQEQENAWLARKYWENERYERELLKYEQMEEYKRAIRDKHFQDYLVTKARLNELARRDMAELERLRASLNEKDVRARHRLQSIRNERSMMLGQRRCDELRKNEAVSHHQVALNHEELTRKREICQRLAERLRRADEMRHQLLDSYLKRLRYDNYLEQLVHEEKLAEAQRIERLKQAQLKDQIKQKRDKTECFAGHRQKRHEALAKKAKISASLRELVRRSVTPELAMIDSSVCGLQPSTQLPVGLERLLENGTLLP